MTKFANAQQRFLPIPLVKAQLTAEMRAELCHTSNICVTGWPARFNPRGKSVTATLPIVRSGRAAL
jgi:hypothetical protein